MDIDTYCLVPIEEWMPSSGFKKIHVAREGGTNLFCQWLFVAPPRHELLGKVLQLVADRVTGNGGVDLNRPFCVHYYTGPDVWTEALRQVIGSGSVSGEIAVGDHGNVVVYPDGFFREQVVRHGYASFEWRGRGYTSWRDELRSIQIANCEPQVERLKNILVPRDGGPLKRFGGRNDGSFLLREDVLRESLYVLSLGNDESFDDDLNQWGIEVNTANSEIAADPGVRLDELVSACDAEAREAGGDGSESGFTLKIDTEGSEYRLLRECSAQVLGRCGQIAVEFHNLPNGGELNGVGIDATWEEREAVVLKLLASHYLVHLHANNHAGLIHGFPEVLECLFVNKRHFDSEPPVWKAGSPRSGLDRRNHPGRPHPSIDWWTHRGLSRPQIALVSLWTGDLAEEFDEFARNKDDYCTIQGYGCHIYQDTLAPERHPAWSKIPVLQRHLQDYEWVFWLDADAVITNLEVKLENLIDSDFDFIASRDQNGLNTGSFLIRNSPRSLEFLEKAWMKEDATPFWDQSAMAEAIAEMPELKVKYLEKRAINSYWCDFRRGDFALHAPSEPSDTKVRMLTIALQCVEGERCSM